MQCSSYHIPQLEYVIVQRPESKLNDMRGWSNTTLTHHSYQAIILNTKDKKKLKEERML